MTKINKLHFNGVDYDIGDNIHGLTEKANPVGTDEIMIADSDASYDNKKVSLRNIQFSFPMSGFAYITYFGYSDNKHYLCGCNNSFNKIILTNEGGLEKVIGGNKQEVSPATIQAGCNYAYSMAIINGYIYGALSDGTNTYLYRCQLGLDITQAINRNIIATLNGYANIFCMGYDGENIILLDTSTKKILSVTLGGVITILYTLGYSTASYRTILTPKGFYIYNSSDYIIYKYDKSRNILDQYYIGNGGIFFYFVGQIYGLINQNYCHYAPLFEA